MADRSEKVMEMVRKELEKDPDVSNKVLYEKATGIDSSVEGLSLRQFHAQYPLQVKRKKSAGKKTASRARKKSRKTRGRRGRRKGRAERDPSGVRSVLLRFAKDVSAAESKAETIDVLTQVDNYVDDVLRAADGRGG